MTVQPNYAAIPCELQSIPQWIVWKYVKRGSDKPTKVPYSAWTGYACNVQDSDAWLSFKHAVCIMQHGARSDDKVTYYDGIGFCFTRDDPYVFIDGDNLQANMELAQRFERMAKAIGSYTELSVSGNGVHIICRDNAGTVNGLKGVRRDGVELYSCERFATFTGHILYGNQGLADGSRYLGDLYRELARGAHTGASVDLSALGVGSAGLSDDEALRRFRASANGEAIFNGTFVPYGQDKSQSAVDQAALNILAAISRDPAQVERLWLLLPCGKRDKVQNRAAYRRDTIAKAFDALPTKEQEDRLRPYRARWIAEAQAMEFPEDYGLSLPVKQLMSFAKVKQEEERARVARMRKEVVAQRIEELADKDNEYRRLAARAYSNPPGILGPLTDFIDDQSRYRNRPLSFATAIFFLATLVSGGYRFRGNSLQQQILLLMASGAGKGAAWSGVKALRDAASDVSTMVEIGTSHWIGQRYIQADIASRQAFVKHLLGGKEVETLRSLGLVLDECEAKFRRFADKNPNPTMADLRTIYQKQFDADPFGKGGPTYLTSNKDNGIQLDHEHAVSMLADTQRTTFEQLLTPDMIHTGFISRWLVLELPDISLEANDKPHLVKPSADLVARIRKLHHSAYIVESNIGSRFNPTGIDGPIEIDLDDDADKAQDEYRHKKRLIVAMPPNEDTAAIVNRDHQKALRLAGLFAVAELAMRDDFDHRTRPRVTLRLWEQAVAFIEAGSHIFTKRVSNGEMGTGDARRYADMVSLLHKFVDTPYEKLPITLRGSKADHEKGIVEYGRLTQYAVRAFRSFRSENEALRHAKRITVEMVHGRLLGVLDNNGNITYDSSLVTYKGANKLLIDLSRLQEN